MLKVYTIEEVLGHYGVIYKLTSPSGKCYIGQSTNIRHRFNSYKAPSLSGVEDQPKIYNALIKYNSDNFIFEIIDLAENLTELNNKEIFYIAMYDSVKNGYNLQYGGSNGRCSEETKIKLSEKRKQLFLDNPEIKDNLIKIITERNKKGHSVESRKNLSNARIKFYKDNPEAKKELIERNKKGLSPESTLKKSKSFKEYHKTHFFKSYCKTFIFIDPKGIVYKIHGGYEKFVIENNLSNSYLKKFLNKGKIPDSIINDVRKNSLTKRVINTIGWEIKIL